jgi:sigma-B regulation protein RsbU (phosphoserine phosphatase)
MRGLLSRLGFGAVAEPQELVHATSPDINGAELAVAYFSGRAGGDFYEFSRVSPNRLLFGLLDLAGKRDNSRPVLAAAQATFRSAGAELFSDPELNEAEAMVELARRLNLEIMRAAGGVRSCPAFAGCYNEELGTVCYVNAGHTPGLLCDQSSIEELPATGLPLGLFSLSPTDARIVGLGPNGALAVVSRGVVEAQCSDEEFGLSGVKLVMGTEPPSATELSRGILAQVQSFVCSVPKHNDVTALSLKRAN